jgi:hypothetical protein
MKNEVHNNAQGAFANAVAQHNMGKMSHTENNAITHSSTGVKTLDFFGLVGASRKTPEQAVVAFKAAFAENPKLAAQALLWSRDVRGGAGERNVFRSIIKSMEDVANFRPYLKAIVPHIPEIGRFDDLLVFGAGEIRSAALDILKGAIWNGNGLAAKWLPRKGKDVPWIRTAFGLSPKAYRKLIVSLTNVVEQKMCAKDWKSIIYSQVPSVAAARYQKAFTKNDADRYAAYRQGLVKGTEKINASIVMPYDVIKGCLHGDPVVAQAQWDALPNWMGEHPVNIIPMVDTSGSMDSLVDGKNRIIDIAISVGLYVAEKNNGAMKNLAFTFQEEPQAINLHGQLKDRITQILAGRHIENTNLQAAFMLLLNIAKKNKVRQTEMPEYILVISDMEFDQGTAVSGMRWRDNRFVGVKKEMTNHEGILRMYQQSGYKIPKIIYWNLQSRSDKNKPVTHKDNNTALVSGFSPAILKAVLNTDMQNFNPLSVMLEAIDVDRYRIFEHVNA